MMNSNKIATADILDILFDGRNKSYGAYELRRHYNQRMRIAVGSVLSICLLIFITSLLAGNAKKDSRLVYAGPDINLADATNDPPPPQVVTPPPARQMATLAVTIPIITPDDQVDPDDMPPPVADIDNAIIATVTTPGDIYDGTVVDPPTAPGTGLAVVPVERGENPDSVYFFVQNPAEFPGGHDAWRRYLERSLQYPETAQENGTQGPVKVQFIVDKEGNISEVQALNDPGDGLAEEAVRIIRKGPKWKPAEQNGRKVIYRNIQAITFVLGN